MEFTTRTGAKDLPLDVTDRIYILRDVAGQIVRAVKAVTLGAAMPRAYTTHDQGAVTEIHDALRTLKSPILVEIRNVLDIAEPEARSNLWLDEEAAQEWRMMHTTATVSSMR
ncbi:MAG: hypothetical protein IPF96_20720 [Rhodobacter sp.]|nr:hypothetical protein [Rhodobacter sp.]